MILMLIIALAGLFAGCCTMLLNLSARVDMIEKLMSESDKKEKNN